MKAAGTEKKGLEGGFGLKGLLAVMKSGEDKISKPLPPVSAFALLPSSSLPFQLLPFLLFWPG
jgi:hypothetical protein